MIAKLYSREVKRNFKVLFANWLPGSPIELGDYGIMRGDIFVPMGKLKNDFPEFAGDVIQTELDPTSDHKEFKSGDGIEVRFSPKGSITAGGAPLAKASLEVAFSRENSVFFDAAECRTTRIANKARLGEIVKSLMAQDRWNRKFCVVTEVVQAGRTTIAISSGRDSSISFEADSPAIQNINLADAGIGFSVARERDIGYKLNAPNGLSILIGLCKMKSPFLTPVKNFSPLETLDTLSNGAEVAEEVDTEVSVDELTFGQLLETDL